LLDKRDISGAKLTIARDKTVRARDKWSGGPGFGISGTARGLAACGRIDPDIPGGMQSGACGGGLVS